MGLAIMRCADGGHVAPVASCDACSQPVGASGVVLCTLDPSSPRSLCGELFLACSPACAACLRAQAGDEPASDTPAWCEISALSYWVCLGLQIDAFPQAMRQSLRDIFQDAGKTDNLHFQSAYPSRES